MSKYADIRTIKACAGLLLRGALLWVCVNPAIGLTQQRQLDRKLTLYRGYDGSKKEFLFGDLTFNIDHPDDASVQVNNLSEEELEIIRQSLRKERLPIFRIRAVDTTDVPLELRAFCSLKNLVSSALQAKIRLHFNTFQNRLAAINIVPANVTAMLLDQELKNLPYGFSMQVDVDVPNNAVGPDYDSFKQRVLQERKEKMQKDTGDSRSFIAKYWMYIIPIAAVVLFSGIANPSSAAGGGGR